MESIKDVIKAKGFTLEQVASQMESKNGGKGITQSALTQMLNGNPSISRVKEIARILGVTVSELVDVWALDYPPCYSCRNRQYLAYQETP